MKALEAKGVKKTFTHPVAVEVLRGIDLEVAPGETVAIVGASGEGKSTLLQILGTLEPVSAGTVEIAGQPVNARTAAHLRNRHIGFVFQSFYLLEDYSTLQNVLMPARIGRRDTSPRSETYHKAMERLERVGLADRAHFPVKLLSGGERQRAAIARALCNEPQLLLADEPSGNLDGATSEAIHKLLLESVEGDRSLITVTHDLTLAQCCDSVYTLTNGTLCKSSSSAPAT